MAITNFLTLKQAVENWLGREGFGQRIPEWISMAEDRIARKLRIQAMEATTDLTISSQTVSVPTGYIETRRLYLSVSDDKPLDYFVPSDFWRRNAANESGQPDIYTIEGQSFVFAPNPDTTYTGKLLYYKRFTDLSSNSDTNWLLTNARALLLYGALLEAMIFFEDDLGMSKYAALFDGYMDDLNEDDRTARYPRGGISSRSEVQVV